MWTGWVCKKFRVKNTTGWVTDVKEKPTSMHFSFLWLFIRQWAYSWWPLLGMLTPSYPIHCVESRHTTPWQHMSLLYSRLRMIHLLYMLHGLWPPINTSQKWPVWPAMSCSLTPCLNKRVAVVAPSGWFVKWPLSPSAPSSIIELTILFKELWPNALLWEPNLSTFAG